MNNSMINPPLTDLLKVVNNRYSLVIVTSKRARQLIEGSEAMVTIDSKKPLTIAIKEVNTGAIQYETLKDGIK